MEEHPDLNMEEHPKLDMEEHPELDEETMATLKRIHIELELGVAMEEEINWQDVKPMPVDPVDLIVEKVNSWKERIYRRFKKSKKAVQEFIPENKAGCELTGELEEAWNLYTRANCDWEGLMSRQDFIGVGMEILKSSCNQMDDVKAAFRVFDHNNDGTISKEELKEAMVDFGTRVTDDEFQTMFAEADQNNDGLIDFDEFVMMMMPSTAAAAGGIM
eukprot:GFUD01069714.1.p1 GENE.GFUD01069714.1~~GFUD01069714.1.p1  ORF type:complete len:217 (+),score=83.48 GFUD01069714.1:150-800(+)